MKLNDRVPLALFLLRAGVFIVMFIWTLDKFVRPEHAAGVFKSFYLLSGLGENLFYTIGSLEMVVIIAFLLGIKRRFTYGVVLLLHGVSTLASFRQYAAPFHGPNLLFFAAWPMLAACFALYYLRDLDTFGVVCK